MTSGTQAVNTFRGADGVAACPEPGTCRAGGAWGVTGGAWRRLGMRRTQSVMGVRLRMPHRCQPRPCPRRRAERTEPIGGRTAQLRAQRRRPNLRGFGRRAVTRPTIGRSTQPVGAQRVSADPSSASRRRLAASQAPVHATRTRHGAALRAAGSCSGALTGTGEALRDPTRDAAYPDGRGCPVAYAASVSGAIPALARPGSAQPGRYVHARAARQGCAATGAGPAARSHRSPRGAQCACSGTPAAEANASPSAS